MSLVFNRGLFLLTLLALPWTLGAGEPSKKAGDTGAVYYWYDGEVRRTVSLATQPKSDSETVASPGASAVFRDGGERMTLPGGVIVRFHEGWGPEQIDQWMVQWRLATYRRLRGGQTWMIETEPGLPALELANRVHESGEVIYASPNWLVERRRR